MIEFLIFTSIIFYLLTYLYISRKSKHDEVLFRFCDERRHIMSYLRKEGESLNKKDKETAIELLEVLNNNIHFYEDYKQSVFNFRRFFINLKNNIVSLEKYKETNNQLLLDIRNNISSIYTLAFIRFTPFLKTEIIINLLLFSMSILIKLGVRRLTGYSETLTLIINSWEKYGLPKKA